MLLSGVAVAQSPLDFEGYATPPKEIASYFGLPRHTQFTLSNLNSARTWFARVKSSRSVNLADISNPYENFGGWMMDTHANRGRTMSYRTGESIVLTNASTFAERELRPPAGAWVSAPTWSPDGQRLMFLVHTPEASTIYIHDVATNTTRQLTSHALLATRVSPEWVGNSKAIAGVFVPANRGAEPVYTIVPSQPKVQVTDKEKNRLRIYRTLLQNQTDQKRLEYFTTGQLEVVDVEKGSEKSIGKPAMIASIESAPNGDFVRVTTTQKPFSYLVPASNFGSKDEVWDASGKALVTLNETKLRNGEEPPPAPGTTPTPPTPPARRSLGWAPDGNGLIYIRNAANSAAAANPFSEDDEQRGQGGGGQGRGQRGGGAGAPQAPVKEELVRWVAPFGEKDIMVLYTADRGLSDLTFSPDAKSIFFLETASGTSTEYRVDLATPTEKKAIWSWSTGEGGRNPGTAVLTTSPLGFNSLDISSGKVLFRRSQNADATPKTFLDSLDVASGKTTTVWQSADKGFETLSGILAADGSRLLIDRQSATDTPNNFLIEGGKESKQITFNKDLAPDLTNAKRYRVQVTRADGMKFWVKVTLPEWYVAGEKLPAFFWFYPSEFDTQDAYDRQARAGNPNAFPNPGGSPKTLLLRRGWAYVEPDCPIFGPRARVNDFYVHDLQLNLAATIDTLEAKGYIDRTKLAIGGHSYGGFSTANALVHTPYFKAGIAGAGNYNRTLTPMAFQTEQRSLFEAPSTYLDMSSMLKAEDITGALLMYCGMDDQNVGTDPINSIRMYNVLESIGKNAALYMYPYEDHGQIARESLMDQWARWIAWLDKWVLGK